MIRRRGLGLSFVVALAFGAALSSIAGAQRAKPISERGAAIKVGRMPGIDRAKLLGRNAQGDIIVLAQQKNAVHTYFVNGKTGNIDYKTPGDLAFGARTVVHKKAELWQERTGKPFPYSVQVGDATGRKLPLITRSGRIRVGFFSKDASRPSRNVVYDLFAKPGRAVMSDPADRVRAPKGGPFESGLRMGSKTQR